MAQASAQIQLHRLRANTRHERCRTARVARAAAAPLGRFAACAGRTRAGKGRPAAPPRLRGAGRAPRLPAEQARRRTCEPPPRRLR
eukprot:3527041-Heterocapsa_arctica.AAC.1